MIKYIDKDGDTVLEHGDEDNMPCPIVLDQQALPCVICGCEPTRRHNVDTGKWELYWACEHFKKVKIIKERS